MLDNNADHIYDEDLRSQWAVLCSLDQSAIGSQRIRSAEA